MINTKKNGPESVHIDGFADYCKQVARAWEQNATDMKKIAQEFPDSICLDTGKHIFPISPDAGNDRVHAIKVGKKIYLSLCGGVKLDENRRSVCAVYPDKVSGVVAVEALAIFREQHPESFEQLRKIIEEHSEAMGSAFEVLPKVE